MCDNCDLYSDDKKLTEMRKRSILSFADDLEKLAAEHRALANQEFSTHTGRSKAMWIASKWIIRKLVADHV